MSETKENIKRLIQGAPKAQLHLHLDGSLSFNFISASLKRLKQRSKDRIVFEKNWEPSNEEELINWFRNLKKSDQNEWRVGTSQNWSTFTVCNYFLQTKTDLFDATYDLVTRLAHEHNVNYIEIRFAPGLHTDEGLTEEEAVIAVANGFEKAVSDLSENSLFVRGGVILCGLRSYPVSKVMSTVQLIQRLKNETILGFDIAGDERTYPLKLFEDVIKHAVQNNIKTTMHAGEWNAINEPNVVDNLKLAVDLGVNRIGHGLALASLDDTDEIFTLMKAKNIPVEICITSNCSNPLKCASFKSHPLSKFLLNGIKVAGLNVDNLLLSGNSEIGCPNPTGEFMRAIYECDVKKEMLLQVIESSYNSAFMTLPRSFIEDSLKTWKESVLPYL